MNQQEWVPLVKIKAIDLGIILPQLEQAGIDYRIEKLNSSNENTGMIPMSATYLDHIVSILYILEPDREKVQAMVNRYFEEKKVQKNTNEDLMPDKEWNRVMLLVGLVFLLAALYKGYRMFSE